VGQSRLKVPIHNLPTRRRRNMKRRLQTYTMLMAASWLVEMKSSSSNASYGSLTTTLPSERRHDGIHKEREHDERTGI
jgi:hypothetical protein